eukprot:UN18798
MGYRRVCGGFRRMPKPPQISAVTHQISHGNHDIFKVPRMTLRPQISLGILVPQILMCSLADFAVSKSQRDCSVIHG